MPPAAGHRCDPQRGCKSHDCAANAADAADAERSTTRLGAGGGTHEDKDAHSRTCTSHIIQNLK